MACPAIGAGFKRRAEMNAMLRKTVNGKKIYLSATGRWVRTKTCAQVFGTMEAARQAAAKHGAVVVFYRFQN